MHPSLEYLPGDCHFWTGPQFPLLNRAPRDRAAARGAKYPPRAAIAGRWVPEKDGGCAQMHTLGWVLVQDLPAIRSQTLLPGPPAGVRGTIGDLLSSPWKVLSQLQRPLPARIGQCRIIGRQALEGSPASSFHVLACTRAHFVAACTEGQCAKTEQVAILVNATAQSYAGSIFAVRRDPADPSAVHTMPIEWVGRILRFNNLLRASGDIITAVRKFVALGG